jgi:hypothetical protein
LRAVQAPRQEPELSFRGSTVHHVAKYSTCKSKARPVRAMVSNGAQRKKGNKVTHCPFAHRGKGVVGRISDIRIHTDTVMALSIDPFAGDMRLSVFPQESLGGPRRELEPTWSYSSLFPPALTRVQHFRSRRRRRRGNRVCVCVRVGKPTREVCMCCVQTIRCRDLIRDPRRVRKREVVSSEIAAG